MAANHFGRYVWLMDILLRYKRLTFEEISKKWQESGLGDKEPLPRRTFNNHRKAIQDIFDVDIECDRKDGYKYYIDGLERVESNNLKSWLISSYATLNQIQADKKLEGRIIFEDIPSGQIWLNAITEAMRCNSVLEITYQGFGKPEPKTFEIEPYCLKVVKRRWYVVARNPYFGNSARPWVYALDRIKDVQETGKTFKMNDDFDVKSYFDGCCGVITSDESAQRIVIRANGMYPDYLRTLPWHESQREIRSDNGSTDFEYQLKPTWEFYQLVLDAREQVEVLEPESVRNEMRRLAQTILSYYTR